MITVRPMMSEDVSIACQILNEIIKIGGSTAFETPFTEAFFRQSFLDNSDKICCHVAIEDQGQVAGFQWLGEYDALPAGWADIATFTRRQPILKGAGRALFGETSKYAASIGIASINATIRADNGMGLRYYEKMGFSDYSVACGVPLTDGTPVDRISKRFDIRRETVS
ncbi:GNAT family N-acetyltransferase [Ruegeria profundi]|uniref:GNAT family N-acetyltransferase n=1 Tax=Ruegeria profundi TaxID=1685378 RepID=UPI001CD3524D|nr:GNAT family N-acetyltransferase [Ruegeria profundi]MCA0927110.1 GNAT family N-acetyltransferase [Ruegeria profundi]